MILYKNYFTFNISNDEVNLISDETEYGRNTVAEINDIYYFLGNVEPNILQAINAWQKIYNKILTPQQKTKIISEYVSYKIPESNTISVG